MSWSVRSLAPGEVHRGVFDQGSVPAACALVLLPLPAYLIAAATIDWIGRKKLQILGFVVMAAAFTGLWLIPGATSVAWLFLILFGATYFFAEFGLETLTEAPLPRSAIALGVAESRGTRPPSA